MSDEAQRQLTAEQAALRRIATLVASEAASERVFEQVTIEAARTLDPGREIELDAPTPVEVQGDRERLRHVTYHFACMGWPAADAQARAILYYSYLFGQSLLDAQVVPAVARDDAIHALLAAPPSR